MKELKQNIQEEIQIIDQLLTIFEQAINDNHGNQPISPKVFDNDVKKYRNCIYIDIGIVNEWFMRLCIKPYVNTYQMQTLLWNLIAESVDNANTDFNQVTKITELGQQINNQAHIIETAMGPDDEPLYMNGGYYDFDLDTQINDFENLDDIPNQLNMITIHDLDLQLKTLKLKLENRVNQIK